jgi:hypothetical protein
MVEMVEGGSLQSDEPEFFLSMQQTPAGGD